MKKLLSLFLILAMCLSVAGCGSSAAEDDSSETKTTKKEANGGSSKTDESSSHSPEEYEPEKGTKEYLEMIFGYIDNFTLLNDGIDMGEGYLGASYELSNGDELPLEMLVIYDKTEEVAIASISCEWDYAPTIYATNLAVALGVDYSLSDWFDDLDNYGYVSEVRDGWSIMIAQNAEGTSWDISFDNGKWRPEDTGSEPESEAEPEAGTSAGYFGDGMYKVGTDIEAGKYYISADGFSSAYWCINEDSAGDSIIANEIVSTFGYFEVQDGEYLKISGGRVIPADEAPIPEPDSNGSYGPGHYLVGRDIPAGEYNVIADVGDSGYYCISYDANTDEIYDNDFFEGNAYVTVSDGQYLSVSSATMTIVE